MRLPDRLDYYEVPVGDAEDWEEYPVVFCLTCGRWGGWTFHATWADLDDDGDVDWDAEHPAHDGAAPP